MRSRGIILWFIWAIILVGCASSSEDFSGSYVSIKINPEVNLLLDENSQISHVFYGNEEAKVVYSDIEFVGKTLSQGIDLIINEAINTGYIDLLTPYNAILVYAHQIDIDDLTFEDDVMGMVERKLEQQGIGGVVLKQSEYNEDLITLIDEYQISIEKAILMDAYSKTTGKDLDSAEKLSVSKLYSELSSAWNDESDANKEAYIKEKKEIEAYFLSSAREYRKGVLQGLIDSPDMTEVMTLLSDDPELLLEKIERRNQEVRPYVQARRSSGLESYVIGQYVFESVRYALTYRVINHYISINGDGTFEESYIWSSSLHDTSGLNTGTWSIKDEKIDAVNGSGFHMYYGIGNGRIIENMLDGNVKTYIKVPSVAT